MRLLIVLGLMVTVVSSTSATGIGDTTELATSSAPVETTEDQVTIPAGTTGLASATNTYGTFPATGTTLVVDTTAEVSETPGYSTSLPGTTEPPVIDDVKRTVIFIQKETQVGHDLFLRGGIDASQRPGCTANVYTDPCAIDIETRLLGITTHYAEYNAWRQGDTRLDWFGGEPLQGNYQGQEALGTPTAWTSNDPTNEGYQELNVYGDHYWMVDMDMNCTQTFDGWFEVKAYMNDAETWEEDVNQVAICSGTAGGTTPYTTVNHHGRCGYINVFTFDSPSCRIENF